MTATWTLYVCHYGAWDPERPEICKDPSGTIVLTCDPRRVKPLPRSRIPQ